jgi:hypothetical protein
MTQGQQPAQDGPRRPRGLQKDDGTGNKVFLEVKYGSICQVSKHELPDYTPIQVTNPRLKDDDPKKTTTKYILKYRFVEAFATKLEWSEREHDGVKYRGWKLHLNADGVQCVLDMPYRAPSTSRFMKMAPNVDWTLPVEFRAFLDKDGRSTVFVMQQWSDEHQKNVNVPQAWTREEPGEMPLAEHDDVEDTWDFRKQTQWLRQYTVAHIIPAIEAAGNEEGTVGVPAVVVEEEHTGKVKTADMKERGAAPAEVSRKARGGGAAGAVKRSAAPPEEPEWPPEDDEIPF